MHSSLSPIGPRAWSFCVELPISAPIPNSPPSVKRVEALTYTQAASTPSWNSRAPAVSFVRIASECPEPWRAMCSIASRGRVDDRDRQRQRQILGVPVLLARRCRERRGLAGMLCDALIDTQLHAGVAQRRQRPRQEHRGDIGVDEQRLSGVAHARTLRLGVQHDRKRIIEVGRCVHVDVTVARRGIDDRHACHLLQSRLQTLAAARDQQVDTAILGCQLSQLATAAAGNQANAALGQSRADGSLCRDRGQDRV